MAAGVSEFPVNDSAENDNLCEPCLLDCLKTSASMLCLECNEFLCEKCASSHRRMKMSRNHNLTEISQLLKVKVSLFIVYPTLLTHALIDNI